MKRSAIWLVAAVLAAASPAFATDPPAVQWLKTFPGMGVSTGYSASQTADGGLVAAGVTEPDSAWAPGYYYIIRMDANGDTLWTRAVRREAVGSVASGIVQTGDGGFAVFGTDRGNDHVPRPYLVRLTSAGAVEWQSTIGGNEFEYGSSIRQTADAGFVVAGLRGRIGIYLRKVNSTGTCQWTWAVTEGVRADVPTFVPVALSGDGGFVTAGHKDSFGLTLWKVNSAGATVWRRVYAEENAYAGEGLIQTADGGFAVVGLAGRTEPDESYRIYLLKVNSNGDKQWCKYYDGRKYKELNSVLQTPNGFVMAGVVANKQDGVHRLDAYVLGTDGNGNEAWYTTLSPSTADAAQSILQTQDGGYVVCGTLMWREQDQHYNHMFVAKLGPARAKK